MLPKERFEERLTQAVSKSLTEVAPPDGLRQRLLARLAKEPTVEMPEGLTESVSTEFDRAFSAAVRASVTAIKAPETTRQRVLNALDESVTRKQPENTVTPIFWSRTPWKQGLAALTSVAAGFAFLFLSLISSTEPALASSISSDHKTCCQRSHEPINPASQDQRRLLEEQFGELPVPTVGSDWTLTHSRLCPGLAGEPMVHLLYSKENDEGKLVTVSLHFIPKKGQGESVSVAHESAREMDGATIPIIAWQDGEWICTACSTDLSTDELMQMVGKHA